MPVYFAQAADGGPIKIGTTSNIPERLNHLRSLAGKDLQILATLDGDHGLERTLHSQFSHIHVRGEWFEPAEDLIRFISINGKRYEQHDENGKKRPTQVWIELPAEELKEIREIAKSRGMPLVTFMRFAIKQHVRRIKEGKE